MARYHCARGIQDLPFGNEPRSSRLRFFPVHFHDAYDIDIRVLECLLDIRELRVRNLENEICFCGHVCPLCVRGDLRNAFR